MGNRREYEIAFVGLKPGSHVFEYHVTDQFFLEFGDQDFRNTNAQVKLTLDKHTSFLLLKFEIGGMAEVTCDRCGNDLPLELWDEFTMLVKMTDEPDQLNEQEADPDVFYISRTESHIDIKNWLYEFINLSFPMHKMCKPDEVGGPKCNKEVLAKLATLNPEGTRNASPIWKGLEKFKNN